MATPVEEIAQHENSIRVLTARVKELRGDTPTVDITERLKVEDEGSTLWDRLTPNETMEMYQNDRPAWEKMMEAKEAAGTRKLLGQ